MRRAGFVLVGGRSSRMGRDKALLPTDGSTLMQEIAAKARAVTGSVTLVGDPTRYGGCGFDCVPDLEPGLGPLGGIYSALASARGEHNLILACDMPGLDVHVLNRLLETAESTAARCVVASDTNSRVHPLCGVYRSDCLEIVAQAQAKRHLRLMDLIEELGAVRMQIDCVLTNCNTPEDWAAAIARV